MMRRSISGLEGLFLWGMLSVFSLGACTFELRTLDGALGDFDLSGDSDVQGDGVGGDGSGGDGSTGGDIDLCPSSERPLQITSPAEGTAEPYGVLVEGSCAPGLEIMIQGDIEDFGALSCGDDARFQADVVFRGEDGPKKVSVSQILDAGCRVRDSRDFVRDVCGGSALRKSDFGGGNGSAEDPYRICTKEQLLLIDSADSNLRTAHYALKQDIVFGGANELLSDAPIAPDLATPFAGHFDGNGHSIIGLHIDSSVADNVGLFGAVQSTTGNSGVPPSIVDLKLEDFSVRGNQNVGALAGFVDNADIDNCRVLGGTFDGTGDIGGLVGFFNAGDISNSSVEGAVLNAPAASRVGGLVGAAAGGGSRSRFLQQEHFGVRGRCGGWVDRLFGIAFFCGALRNPRTHCHRIFRQC